jgi:uncharacterized membrane protein (UPF0127 family)
MFKQIILPILGVIAFIVIVGVFVQKSGNMDFSKSLLPQSTPKTKTIVVSGKTINVEIADTTEARKNGLSGRTSLEKDSGMLFVFDAKGVSPSFWMKDMVIPLDILWIGNDKIVRIDKDVPAPIKGSDDSKLKVYSAGKPIDYVLEVASGYSDQNGFKIGDSVDTSGI